MGQIGEQIFSTVEAQKTQKYFVYFKFFGQKQAENMPPRCAQRFIQRFLKNILLYLYSKRRKKVSLRPFLKKTKPPKAKMTFAKDVAAAFGGPVYLCGCVLFK